MDWGFESLANSTADSDFVLLVSDFIRYKASKRSRDCLAQHFALGLTRTEIANACLCAVARAGVFGRPEVANASIRSYLEVARQVARVQAGIPRAVIQSMEGGMNRRWRLRAKPMLAAILEGVDWPMKAEADRTMWIRTHHDAIVALMLCGLHELAVDIGNRIVEASREPIGPNIEVAAQADLDCAQWIRSLVRSWVAAADARVEEADGHLRTANGFISGRCFNSTLEYLALNAAVACGVRNGVELYFDKMSKCRLTVREQKILESRARAPETDLASKLSRFVGVSGVHPIGAALW